MSARRTQRLSRRRRAFAAGFTLVELMVALALLTLLIGILVNAFSNTTAIWKQTRRKVEEFQQARGAFEVISRRLSQATLNAYLDYDQPTAPKQYERRSELRFVSGPVDKLLGAPPTRKQRWTHAVFFQAPLGVTSNSLYSGFENLLCTCGYFLEYGDDTSFRPAFITSDISPARWRPRILELVQPSESDVIYSYTSGLNGTIPKAGTYAGYDWFTKPLAANGSSMAASPVRVVSENIIALVLTPRVSQQDEAQAGVTAAEPDYSPLAPNYQFDSSPVASGASSDPRYSNPLLNPVAQLPPIVQVTLVAIAEESAYRMGLNESSVDPFSLQGKFQESKDLDEDLAQLEASLIARHINYRVFDARVAIRGAKWSRQ